MTSRPFVGSVRHLVSTGVLPYLTVVYVSVSLLHLQKSMYSVLRFTDQSGLRKTVVNFKETREKGGVFNED